MKCWVVPSRCPRSCLRLLLTLGGGLERPLAWPDRSWTDVKMLVLGTVQGRGGEATGKGRHCSLSPVSTPGKGAGNSGPSSPGNLPVS